MSAFLYGGGQAAEVWECGAEGVWAVEGWVALCWGLRWIFIEEGGGVSEVERERFGYVYVLVEV